MRFEIKDEPLKHYLLASNIAASSAKLRQEEGYGWDITNYI
jgi:hypothetical protein